jgi:hypothetical protein
VLWRGMEAGGCGFWQERVARSKWATLVAPEGDLAYGDALPAGRVDSPNRVALTAGWNNQVGATHAGQDAACSGEGWRLEDAVFGKNGSPGRNG